MGQAFYNKQGRPDTKPSFAKMPTTAIGSSFSGMKYVGYAKQGATDLKVYFLLRDEGARCELGFTSEYGKNPGFWVAKDKVVFDQAGVERFGSGGVVAPVVKPVISQEVAWEMVRLLKEFASTTCQYCGGVDPQTNPMANRAVALIAKAEGVKSCNTGA